MLDFHKDKQRYFDYQYWTARDYILPFVAEFLSEQKPLQVLEIGCAEAGVLKAFVEQGHSCTGIELSEYRLADARIFLKEAYQGGQIRFVNKNIYDIRVEEDLGTQYDLILLKDVIEHIPNQGQVLAKMKDFLKPGGLIFFGFPPWQMPFGGHQQICDSRFLRYLPWFHMLPADIYRKILNIFGEQETIIQELMDIKSTGISIETFERFVTENQFQILKKKFFLTNPIYQYKFGWKPIEQWSVLASIPHLRNFFTTAAYYVVR